MVETEKFQLLASPYAQTLELTKLTYTVSLSPALLTPSPNLYTQGLLWEQIIEARRKITPNMIV